MLKCVSILFAIALALANDEPPPAALLRNSSRRNGEYNRYYLYNSQVSGVELAPSQNSNLLNYYGKTVVVIHGYMESHLTSLNPDLRRELLNNEDVNVIAVDWSIYAAMSLPFAQNAVLSVGDYLANFLMKLNLNPASLHLVGADLGAHIAGVAGRKMGGRVARITGLSPTTSNVRLASTDAVYVEVIHTGTDCPNGIEEKLGHADFYPNGGTCQPGCLDCTCHQNRSWMYFVASIKDNNFNANCCNSKFEKDINACKGTYLPMGNNKLIKMACPTGLYRVNTKDTYPY
ncbi:pancreatic lipase-related protein 2-like [Plodia interpunctella]|uniref:pancreatic lipase-related protein 2-like n=1 Tax=Plodia interpunctella TaxID=58824 RepID=UPI00236898D9|nr:pancreatic lipase-related protein 2-like [Plodia interpunctella]